MKNKDLYDLGEQIKSMVESAVDSQDFRKLNQTVSDAISQALDGVKKGMESCNRATYTVHETVKPRSSHPVLYVKKPAGRISGPLMSVLGFSFGGIFGVTALAVLLPGLVLGNVPLYVTGGIFGILCAGSMIIGGIGSTVWGRIKRYRKYVRRLNDREFCKIEELCSAVGKKRDVVIKDLKKMIDKGFFLQGHMDEQNQYLMTTDQVYEQYQNSQRELRRRQQMEEALPNEECRTILKEGNEYIRQIHRANDDIPGEVMSQKLDRLESIMIKIFRQVEKDPDIAQELHKFMNYYLPTTMKLIEAYRELDVENLSGEHISGTKQEIEDTLDTINTAFENLLDRFFQDKAWDISSDITVMKNMLEQEGLVEQSLKMPVSDKS